MPTTKGTDSVRSPTKNLGRSTMAGPGGSYWTTLTSPYGIVVQEPRKKKSDPRLVILSTRVVSSGFSEGARVRVVGRDLPSIPDRDLDVRSRIERIASDTYFSSSIEDRVSHPDFAELSRLGPGVLSAVLLELDEYPLVAMMLAAAISGEDPVPDADAGAISKMAEHWKSWGIQNGYLQKN